MENFEFCVQGNFRPFRPPCQRANLKLVVFQCLKLFHCVWANSRRNENVSKSKRAKITRCENNNTYSICLKYQRDIIRLFLYSKHLHMNLWQSIISEFSISLILHMLSHCCGTDNSSKSDHIFQMNQFSTNKGSILSKTTLFCMKKYQFLWHHTIDIFGILSAYI